MWNWLKQKGTSLLDFITGKKQPAASPPNFSTVTPGANMGTDAQGNMIIGEVPATDYTSKYDNMPTSYGGGYSTAAGDAILASGLAKLKAIFAGLPTFTPGTFDEALVRSELTNPQGTGTEDVYYKSKLDTFLKGIDLQRSQGAETETRLLNNLTAGTERYMAGEKQQFDIAKQNALQSVVGGGNQLSGFGGRMLGQQAALEKTKLADFMAGQGESRAGLLEQGTQLGQQLGYKTDLEKQDEARQKALDIESGIINRRDEFVNQEMERQAAAEAARKEAVSNAALSSPELFKYLGGSIF